MKIKKLDLLCGLEKVIGKRLHTVNVYNVVGPCGNFIKMHVDGYHGYIFNSMEG